MRFVDGLRNHVKAATLNGTIRENFPHKFLTAASKIVLVAEERTELLHKLLSLADELSDH